MSAENTDYLTTPPLIGNPDQKWVFGITIVSVTIGLIIIAVVILLALSIYFNLHKKIERSLSVRPGRVRAMWRNASMHKISSRLRSIRQSIRTRRQSRRGKNHKIEVDDSLPTFEYTTATDMEDIEIANENDSENFTKIPSEKTFKKVEWRLDSPHASALDIYVDCPEDAK